MRKVLVTIETDGLRDFVRLPDGHRKILGTLSVLRFLTKVAPKRELVGALNSFNATGSCVVTADLDVMEELMAPRRSRWAADDLVGVSPLMGDVNRTSTRVEGPEITMEAKSLLERLGKIEQTVTTLDKYAKHDGGLIAPKIHEGLRAMVSGLHFYNPGDQSKNDAWYTGGGKVDTADGNADLPASHTHAQAIKAKPAGAEVSTAPVMAPTPGNSPVYAPGTKSASTEVAAPVAGEASYATLKDNTTLAEGILSTVEETNAKVESLVTAGRQFNASKASSDLYAIASRVTEILNNVDLAQPWVRKDLAALDGQAKHIHGLFASARV